MAKKIKAKELAIYQEIIFSALTEDQKSAFMANCRENGYVCPLKGQLYTNPVRIAHDDKHIVYERTALPQEFKDSSLVVAQDKIDSLVKFYQNYINERSTVMNRLKDRLAEENTAEENNALETILTESNLICPIELEAFTNPVRRKNDTTKQVYDRDQISKWVNSANKNHKRRDPLSGQTIGSKESKKLYPALDIIEKMIQCYKQFAADKAIKARINENNQLAHTNTEEQSAPQTEVAEKPVAAHPIPAAAIVPSFNRKRKLCVDEDNEENRTKIQRSFIEENVGTSTSIPTSTVTAPQAQAQLQIEAEEPKSKSFFRQMCNIM